MQKIKGLIGMRTIKTVIAVIITSLLMKYVLHATPFFACIGAVVAMEKTMSHSFRAAIIRNVGTAVGGLVGIAVHSFTSDIFLMGLGLIPFIIICNIIDKKDSIVPGAIVYFAVFYLNTEDLAWVYGLTRIAGTFVGTLVALAINAVILPPKNLSTDINQIESDEKPTSEAVRD